MGSLSDVESFLNEAVLISLDQAAGKFRSTGTAEIVVGKKYGIAIKDEGEYISVRFGSEDLTPIGSVPTGEKSFATAQEAFDFARQIQLFIISRKDRRAIGAD